jgi:predicted HicB family RNase H-like nuclease
MSRGLGKILILTCLAIGYTILSMTAKTEQPKRRHSSALYIRVIPEHEELIRQAAERAGVSISDWIRERLIRTARKELAEKV